MSRFVSVAVLLVLLLYSLMLLSLPPTEYQVKAALIYNFLRFVELDKDSYKGNTIVICSFKGNILNEEVKKLNGANVSQFVINFREIQDENNLDECSVLILNKRDDESLKKLLEETYLKKIFTISDIDGYGEKGVVINMFIADERVRFEINIEAATKSGVKISSRLLSLAKIIKNINQ